MADRVYPAAKPGGGPPNFTTKAQLYGATRAAYRPTAPSHRYRRSRCCSCCLWLSLVILILLILVAAAAAVFYFLYRPHAPAFSVSSVSLSTFNLTKGSHLNSEISLQINARNPNKKLVYVYDPFELSLSTGDVPLGQDSFPGFVHGTQNSTLMKFDVKNSNAAVDSAQLGALQSAQNKKSLELSLRLDTKVRAKVGSAKSGKIRVRVSCDGINAAIGGKGKDSSPFGAKCDVKLRIKIFKWVL
ncbi:NDR1/HIN1-like protein 13 [Amborella trichopoda]|uniref:Late embryogenesis abundant protein LEA-2 subgroup domain-containing protein n=1 Tax=Amborella trichopoda TaxID=13333 RepID=W1NEW9_AMBTC|nr:NDR1/HIN1-like protein 13 [Amborella trichopoda]ERM93973.1 hypothetical protein AMTR_s00136p00047510 [Amborella trichopoda]|eukprot:XP_006826736.1 NDR1/HIN1-like protein 13 [Amborella trichopoda]